jgi:hypothetical protein
MALNTVSRQAVWAALLLGVATLTPAQSLDIRPGLWKKSMKMETGGKAVMNSTLDACLTAEDLDLKRSTDKLSRSPSCKVLKQDLSPKAIKVVVQCREMSIESSTLVKGREHVVVSATIKPAGGGEVTLSSEEWRFVKPDCARKSR